MPTETTELTDERWLDFWTNFQGLEHQREAVVSLGRQIKQADPSLLVEGADWAEQFSPAAKPSEGAPANIQSWLTFLTGPEVESASKGKISPLTLAEACGFVGCIIVETGQPNLDRLDVVEAGSGAGRGAMQYTGVRRGPYDKARAAAVARGVDPNSNAWQQTYFAEEYAGLHDTPQGSLIGWTRIFEDRPAGMTPAAAAAYWTGSAAAGEGYFRPGVPHLDRRQQEAERIWGLAQGGTLASQPERQPAKISPSSPFTAHLSRNFTLGEFALGQEGRRFAHQYQVDVAAELAAFLERVRRQFGDKPVIITSGYRPPAINRQAGGASASEHLYSEPGVGAVDVYVDGVDIQAVQDWCDREWPYSVGYGAPKGFVHLGIRSDRPRVRWDY